MSKQKLALGLTLTLALIVVITITVVSVTELSKNEETTITPNLPSTTTPTTISSKASPLVTSPTISEVTKKPYDPSMLTEDEKSRINCFLEEHSKFENLTEYQCVNVRGCIYKPSQYDKVPTCYFDRTKLGYEIVESSIINNSLEYHQLFRTNRQVSQPFLGEINELTLTLEYLGKNIIHVKITDSNDTQRYEIPYTLNKPPLNDKSEHSGKVVFSKKNEFSYFKIVRSSDDNVLFDTSFGGFIYSDQFLQISTLLNRDSPYIYGFGENNHESLLHNFDYTSWGMFGRDNAPGWGDNRNNYGFQPVYLSMEKSGKSHLVLLYNSNAMGKLSQNMEN